MERWVAIAIGLLVIVIGFLVVQSVNDGIFQIEDTGDDVECITAGGQCLEQCIDTDPAPQFACREGRVCCR